MWKNHAVLAPNTTALRLIGVFIAAISAFALLIMVPGPASAEQPDVVVGLIDRNDGVYVPTSRNNDIDRTAVRAALAEADTLGFNAAVIAPLDPWPNNEAFALRVRQAGEYDIIISFGPDGEIDGSVDSEVEGDPLRARKAARAAASPQAAVSAYLTALVTEPVRETPSLAGDILKWAVVLVFVLAASVVLESYFRKRRAVKRATESPPSKSQLVT